MEWSASLGMVRSAFTTAEDCLPRKLGLGDGFASANGLAGVRQSPAPTRSQAASALSPRWEAAEASAHLCWTAEGPRR